MESAINRRNVGERIERNRADSDCAILNDYYDFVISRKESGEGMLKRIRDMRDTLSREIRKKLCIRSDYLYKDRTSLEKFIF